MPGLRITFALLTLCLLTLASCSGDPEAPTPESTAAPETGQEQQAAEPLPELDPEELAPVIREVGETGAGPTKIVIELAKAVVDKAQVNQPLTGTELRIEPPLDGELRFTSPSTLTFSPAAGFRPATRYEIELVALETTSGVLKAPSASRWERVFTTPAFDFTRFSLASIDYPRQRAEVHLVFSGTVEAKEVQRRARLSVIAPDGRARRGATVRFQPGPQPHMVLAKIASDGLRGGGRLDLVLADGIPSAADPGQLAGKQTASVDLALGPVAKIVDTYRAEGANGFYVQVICDDAAVGSRRYHWDRVQHEYYKVSTRCQLDEADAAFGIHFEPAVKYSVSPAGAGFRIFGDFARGSYHLRIDAGVKTADGGMLHQDYETDFTVPARSPTVRFLSKGRYLPRAAWSSLPLRHLNVSSATLSVRHVPEENLVFWMSDDENEAADERTSNLILQQQIPLRGDSDIETTTYVDVGALVPADLTGLIELRLAAGEAHDTARILLTDMHLVAKRDGPDADGQRKVWVWVMDMDTLEPVLGVDVQLLRKSGYAIASCRTWRGGTCALQPPANEVDPSEPFALLARTGDDLTYLKLDELKAEVQEARIAGEPYRGDAKYRAAVYSDRGVYRPGETAHLAAIVRQENHLAPPAGMPAVAVLTGPRGKTLKRTALATNNAGYLALDYDFPAFATTGRYEARVEVADQTVGQYRFQVEEFVPERMKVEVASREPQYLAGDVMDIAVEARYLFGGVPAKHRVDVSCEIVPGNFEPRQNASFHYGVWRPENSPARPLPLGNLTAELNEAGAGTYRCPGAGRAGGFRGPARLIARAAVFESGSGRTTVNQTSVPVHPESFYIGLSSGATKIEAGNEVVVDGVIVDWQGNLAEGSLAGGTDTVTLQLIRLESEYGWYYDEALGHETYRRYLRPVTEATTDAPVTDGKFRAAWKPGRDAVAFLIRASAGAARTDLQIEGSGDWYYWAPDETEVDQTPRPGRPTWIALETPDKAHVGERFPVHFKAPYRGRMLLTAETDRVLRAEWADVEPGDAVWFVELDELTPNVYITAFLIKDPHLDSPQAFLPDRAFGVRSVTVEPRELTHSLTLEAPAEIRSGSRLSVSLDLGATDEPTYATVAAVDQGVLSLTRFESPDPFTAIFARRALAVETFETVGWTLLVPPAGPSGTTGGDGAGSLGRVQPVKPVALWSGLMEVPASGRLEVDFDLPQYRGELRVMAVTASDRRMGHAEAKVTVRDPLVVQATLPRFLVRGDDIRLPVHVTNLSPTRREVEVRLASETLAVGGLQPADETSPVEIIGPASRTLTLDSGVGDVALFRVKARQPVGAARLQVTASSDELESQASADVPLLPAGPKSRLTQRIELTAGSQDLTPYLGGWVPLSERSTLWVTANPHGDAFDHLDHLVRYPYGCIEQTTSTTRPLLYLAELIDRVDPSLIAGKDIDNMVRRGIRRLFSMQTPDGGFAYWPGAAEPTYWGSAYATHLLLDAQAEGYPVSRERLDEALDWMDRQITSTFESGRHREDGYSRNAEPYFHFVLAQAGRAHKARVQRLIDELPTNPHNEQREHLFMLQAALYQAGDHRYERQLKSPDLSLVTDYRDNGWSFYSDRRRRGFMLATFVDLFGQDPAGESLANLVAQSLRGRKSSWYTTQELVWGVTGLGKQVAAAAQDFAPPRLLADGRNLGPLKSEGTTSDRTWQLARASEYRQLDLEVPAKGDGKLYLILASEGVRETPDWRTGGEGLLLARRYFDGAGKLLDLGRGLNLGDVIHVELTLRNNTDEEVANIALVDRIPAGWEIENPRLGRDAAIDWIDAESLWKVDHMDLRDDRIELFGHLGRGQSRKVVYAARAVTAGRFTIPPVEAEAMYDPRLWAREGMKTVEIAGPWAQAKSPIAGGAP